MNVVTSTSIVGVYPWVVYYDTWAVFHKDLFIRVQGLLEPTLKHLKVDGNPLRRYLSLLKIPLRTTHQKTYFTGYCVQT